MLRSMFTAISGLTTHQYELDVVADNIANINTTGFKGSRVTFASILSQTIEGASAPTSTAGGQNPEQVGLGVNVASTDTLFTQGTLETTGVNTDMAIEGEGFFIIEDADGVVHYTRCGTFTLDADGNLVSEVNGYKIQGWNANAAGTIDTGGVLADVVVPSGSTIAANATTEVDFSGNLQSTAYGTITFDSTAMEITDGDGAGTTTVTWTFTPTGNFNEWTATGTLSAGTWTSSGTDTLTYTFHVDDSTGIVDVSSGPGATDTIDIDGGGADITVNLINVGTDFSDATADVTITTLGTLADTTDTDMTAEWTAAPTYSTSIVVYDSLGNTHTVEFTFTHDETTNNQWTWAASGDDVTAGNGTITFNTDGSYSTMTTTNAVTLSVDPAVSPQTLTTIDLSSTTQYASADSLVASGQDGYEAGTLESFTVGSSGVITGSYTNGLTQDLAQIALATFINPSGLLAEGDNMFASTANSGIALVGAADTGNRGTISGGTLEMSNVDLATEFVEMITAQRGFQANSSSITTADEILQEVINLKR